MKDGGPAFPYVPFSDQHNGMSLRDVFAAVALQGIISCPVPHTIIGAGEIFRLPDVAETAYKYADVMLIEREKTK